MGEILINSLIKGLELLVKKPHLILASLIFSIIGLFAVYLNIETVTYFFLNLAFGIVPSISPKTQLFDFILMYSNEIFILLLLFLFILLLNFLAYAVYAAFVKEYRESKRASFSDSFKSGFSKLPSLLAFVLIIFFLGIFLSLVFLFLMWLLGNNFLLSLILAILMALFIVYLILKLVFAVPALFDVESKTNRTKIKSKNSILAQAISKSWNFSSFHLPETFVLLLILTIVSSAFGTVFGNFASSFADETMKIAVSTLLASIISAYCFLALSAFYYKKYSK